jgi:PAS domain S-box-containing protein
MAKKPTYKELEKRVHELERSEFERKQTEEALRESDEQYRTIGETVPYGVWLTDATGYCTYVSKSFLELVDMTMEQVQEFGWLHLLPPEDVEPTKEHWLHCVETGENFEREHRFRTKDGNYRNVLAIGRPVKDATGKIVKWVGLNLDITERKLTEEALKESEEKFGNIFKNDAIGKSVTMLDGTMNVNPAFCQMLGYTMEELTHEKWQNITHPDDIELSENQLKQLRSGEKKSVRFIKRYLKKDGSIIWADTNVVLQKGRRDNPLYYITSIMDITERKRTEEEIQASLQEKELLLREIHHRVKNNMQVISGLLDLQASLSGNPELIEMLNESQNQIRSMALVHEKLYGSKDFSRIDLAGYVRSLSQDLFHSYKINPKKIDLTIQTDGDVYVDINKAIPCGLILNELISNALKHAFSGDRHGELQIIIHETKNTEIKIVVRDNGFGLPDDVDIHQPRTVGLHLVNGLVKNQLDGQIEVRRDNGTEIRITFPL